MSDRSVNVILNGQEHNVPNHPSSFVITPRQLGYTSETSGSLELQLSQLKVRGLQCVQDECICIEIQDLGNLFNSHLLGFHQKGSE